MALVNTYKPVSGGIHQGFPGAGLFVSANLNPININPNTMKKVILSLLSVAAVAITAHAGPAKSFKEEVVLAPECKFRDMEFQIDGFYSGIFGSSGSRINTGSGGGVGLNFFFARYFGLGYEAFWTGSNNGTSFPLGGTAFFRYPICSLNLAPYIMVGGGAAWPGSTGYGYGNVGGGLEYRFTNNIGIFVDSRYFYGGTGNLANLRSGLRIAF